MSTRADAAARRHLERSMRDAGYPVAYAKQQATRLPISAVRARLPLWRRLLAAVGQFPAKGGGGARKSEALPSDTASTFRKHKHPDSKVSR